MTKIKKIIFITGSFFCKRDRNLFDIDFLKTSGYDVEIWEVVEFLNPNLTRSILAKEEIIFDDLKVLRTKREIQKELANLDRSVFVFALLYFNPKTHFIYRTLSRRKIKYSLFEAIYAPFGDSKLFKKHSSLIDRIKMRLSWSWFLMAIIRRLPLWLLRIKPADYVFAGGAMSHGRVQPQNRITQTIFLHSPDYDRYLLTKDQICDDKSNSMVFLDSYFPFHPDFIYTNKKPPVSVNKYYSSIRVFFDYIEKLIGCKVIVAAHPRSSIQKLTNYFGGREIIKNKTDLLVQKSPLVITHASGSTNFPVLFNKPVLFITTNELENSFVKPWIDVMAAYLDKKAVNIDESLNLSLEELFRINETAYHKYKNDYIKKEGTEEGLFWQLVANKIKQIGVANVDL